MTTAVTLNNQVYQLPVTNDTDWGITVTAYLTAIAASCLQKSGGVFTLSADADFGSTYGLASNYYKSRTANVAASGTVRLANNSDSVAWRNATNAADLALKVDGSNELTFNSVKVLRSGLIVDADVKSDAAIAYSKLSLTGNIVDADIKSSAAIAYSKLSLTGNIVDADIKSSAAIAWSKIDKTGSNLTDIATRSHTALSDIGTNAHSAIDSHLGASSSVHGVTGNVVGTTDTQDLSNKSVTTDLIFKNQAVAKFREQTGNGTNYIGLEAPDAVTSDVTFKLPNGDGTPNQVLYTDGSQNLGWATVATTNLSQYNVNVGNSSNIQESVNTNLLGDIYASVSTATVTFDETGDADGDYVVKLASHGLTLGHRVYFTNSGGALPTSVNASTTYYVADPKTNTFKLSTSRVGAVLAFTGDGSGTSTVYVGGLVNKNTPDSSVYVSTGTGHGSTGTKIRTFTSGTATTVGTDITYTPNPSNNGDTFTINRNGVYTIAYSDVYSTDGANIGISVNSNQLTTNVYSITVANCLAFGTSASAGVPGFISVTARLNAGDVIRAHDNGLQNSTDAYRSWFRVTQVAKT